MTDQTLFLWIHGLAGKSQVLDFFGIFFADYLGYFLILGAIFLIWSLKDYKKQAQYLFFTVLTLILSRGIFTELIRFLYYRPRPYLALNFTALVTEDHTSALPSGHAAAFFALAGIVYLLNKKWGQYFIGAAAIMSVARVFAGVHWPLDIIAGALVGFLSVYLVNRLLPLPKLEENQKLPR